jgi:uncharacterized cupin superfamily protein
MLVFVARWRVILQFIGMTGTLPNIVNVNDVPEITPETGEYWRSFDKRLAPAHQPRMGRLGVNLSRVPPGKSSCPFHTHQLEDEVFYVLAGRGVFRYGTAIQEIKPGDCISCPAGSGIAHQLANPFSEDLVYLAIGMNDPNEVCTYPDSGKVMVNVLDKVGFMNETDYWEGEPEVPRIFGLANPPS